MRRLLDRVDRACRSAYGGVADLADYLGVHRKCVYVWVRYRRKRPSQHHVERMAEWLKEAN